MRNQINLTIGIAGMLIYYTIVYIYSQIKLYLDVMTNNFTKKKIFKMVSLFSMRLIY